MNVSKLVRILGIVMVLALMVGATSAQDDERKVLVTGIGQVGGDLSTMDPALSETAQEHAIITELFPGLAMQNVEGELAPGVATSWDVSEDGLTYTYHLLEELPWVIWNPDTEQVEQVMDENGDVRFVTAEDVIYGWRRTLDPETASPYGSILADYVTGGVEALAGEGSVEDLGITAVDDYTIEVSMPEAVSFAPAIHGLWMATPQPQWAIEEFGDEWTEGGNMPTYGPFALREWAHDESISIVKNPFWPGTEDIPQPMLDEVIHRFIDPQVQFTEYQAGTIDAAEVPVEQIEFVLADATLSSEFFSTARPCTYYLGFDNTEAPLDNANLRRALSLSIDRASLTENVTKRGEEPAQWFARPGLNAAPTMDTHPDLGIQFDVEAAQAALQTALDELGLASVDELPPLTASYGDRADHAAIMQAIQQMWADNLGIQVQLAPMDPTTYFDMVSEDAPMIFRSGWCSDYNDANNFLYDVLWSQSTQNDTGFSNADYDALVEQARVETDTEARLELYAQAEEILVDQEAGVAPIYWYVYAQLAKPNVVRVPSLSGRQHYELWDIQ